MLYKLGLRKREFTPKTFLYIGKQSVAKRDLHKYEEVPLTIQEMYALGEGADLSAYKGKLAKGSNYLIFSDKVDLVVDKGRDAFGSPTTRGTYTYSEL